MEGGLIGSMGLIALMIDKLGGTYWSLVGEFFLSSLFNQSSERKKAAWQVESFEAK